MRLSSHVSEQSGPGSGRAIAGDGNTAQGHELTPALLQPLPGACLRAAAPSPCPARNNMIRHCFCPCSGEILGQGLVSGGGLNKKAQSPPGTGSNWIKQSVEKPLCARPSANRSSPAPIPPYYPPPQLSLSRVLLCSRLQ